ncbi:MAG: hypothetical protein IJ606_03380 [Bacteroidaceae bacterium]|nr:hypothetical protein [Bacteroidaceae bacterium]
MVTQNIKELTGVGMKLPELIFIIAAIIFYLSPSVQYEYREAALISSLGYIAFCIRQEPRYIKIIIKFLSYVLCLVLLYITLTESTSISKNVNHWFIKRLFAKSSQYILMFLPLFFFFRVIKHATKRQIRNLIFVSLLTSAAFLNYSFSMLAINAHALHTFRSDAVEDIGFAGFYFVYAYTFIIIAGLELFKMANKGIHKAFFAILILICLYFLVKAQYALSLVTTFISLLYLYSKSATKSSTKFVVIAALIFIALMLPLLIKLFISVSGSPLLNERLQEIYNGITGENSTEESDMESRLTLYRMSLEAFFSSPILGNRNINFNPHSTFLAIIADLGIAGGYIIYKLFRGAFSFMKSITGKDFFYFRPLICQILLMGFTNPIHSAPSNFIMLWFVAPLMIHYYKNIVRI